MYKPLDGLRGLMAIWVFAHHLKSMSGSTTGLIPSGAIAVDVFMLISGFLMCAHYRERALEEPWTSHTTWARFYLRRFFRIAPLYYVAFAVVGILGGELSDFRLNTRDAFPPQGVDVAPDGVTDQRHPFASALLHFSFLFGFFPAYGASSQHIPDWSLGLEAQFYVLFPFLMLFMRRFGYGALVILCTAAFLLSHKFIGVYTEPKLLGLFPQPTLLPLKINCFLVGMLLAEAHYKRDSPEFSLLAAAAVFLSFYRQDVLFGMTATGLLVLLLGEDAWDRFGVGMPARVARNILGGRPGHHLGEISYGIYLFHIPIALPIAAALAGRQWYLHQPANVRLVILFGLSSAPVYLVARFGYTYIERPFIAFVRRFLAGHLRQPPG
ncbi:MAG: acyltransferase family protein [Bacteroidota bacterium]